MRRDTPTPAAQETAKSSPVDEWAQQVWTALDRLRGSYDVGSYIEFVLGLLYLRVREPAQWQRLTHESDGNAVLNLLSWARLPADVRPARVPLFEAVPQTSEVKLSLVEMVRSLSRVDSSDFNTGTTGLIHFVDHLLIRFERSTDEHLTPGSLVRCMVKLVDPQKQDHVYDPFCRLGELLAAAVTHVKSHRSGPTDPSVFGQVPNQRFWRLSTLNATLHGFHIDLGADPSDTLRGDVHPDRCFDVILANPPFNMSGWAGHTEANDRRWTYGVPPRHNANFAWLQHIVSKLRPGGRAAVLMPNSTTTVGSTAESAIRARMTEAGVIDCVVALPGQLFRSTGIPVSLWILRRADERKNREILLIDATDLGAMTDRIQRVLTEENLEQISQEYHRWRNQLRENYEGRTGFARSVDHREIHKNDNVLNPRAYVRPATSETNPQYSPEALKELRGNLDRLRARSESIHSELDAQLARIVAGQRTVDTTREGWTQVRLEEFCEVLAGPGTVDRGEHQPSWVPIVLPRNIKHNRINDDQLDAVTPQNAVKLSRYQLAPGDIVCTRTGTLGRHGLVRPEQEGWLLGPGCMRLRPNEHVDPEYLTCYLNSPAAFTWLTANATGSAVHYISTRTLGRMPIDLPGLSVQREIGTILGTLDSEVAVQSQIGSTTQMLRDLLLPLLIPAHPGAHQAQR